MVAKVTPEERKCLVCPNTFLVGGTGNRKRSQVYCSSACRASAKVNTNGRPAAILSPTDAAYLAGVVDSDGHIGLYGRKTPSGSLSIRPRLAVTNTNTDLLDWIQERTTVGKWYIQFKGSEVRKKTYSWTCTSGQATTVVEQLIPFMIVKRDRAELLVDFWYRLQDPIQKADKTWQNEYRDRMLAFNRRGPGPR